MPQTHLGQLWCGLCQACQALTQLTQLEQPHIQQLRGPAHFHPCTLPLGPRLLQAAFHGSQLLLQLRIPSLQILQGEKGMRGEITCGASGCLPCCVAPTGWKMTTVKSEKCEVTNSHIES